MGSNDRVTVFILTTVGENFSRFRRFQYTIRSGTEFRSDPTASSFLIGQSRRSSFAISHRGCTFVLRLRIYRQKENSAPRNPDA